MIDQSVSEVMRHSPRTVTEATTASAVARLFAENGIGCAVVVDESDEVVGVVTESDIMHQVAADADVASITVGSFMTTPVITIRSTESIDTAATVMRDNSIRRLPVVDDDQLVGVVTTTDLSHYLPRLRDAILRARNERSGG